MYLHAPLDRFGLAKGIQGRCGGGATVTAIGKERERNKENIN